MTAPSRDGRDSPFSDWLRNHPEIDSQRTALYLTDIDYTFCKFRPWVDTEGTREVKLMLDVEAKTFGRSPDREQQEVLFFRHQLLCRKQRLWSTYLKRNVSVWHFGQYLLRFIDGDRPDNSSKIYWGKFWCDEGDISKKEITEKILIEILRFDIAPDTLKKLSLRRHHHTGRLAVVDNSGLFPYIRHVVERS